MKQNTAIILGMYIGPSESRKKMYQDNVLDWLHNTPYDIYTVNSSGHILDITHDRLFEFTFKQDETHMVSHQSKPLIDVFTKLFIKKKDSGPTQLEKNSILKTFTHFPALFSYDMVFKITGKYFCPDFERHYNSIPSADIIIQKKRYAINPILLLLCVLAFILLCLYMKINPYRIIFMSVVLVSVVLFIYLMNSYEEPTELLGMKPRLLHDFFNGIDEYTSSEKSLHQFITRSTQSVVRMPSLPISRKFPRNDGSVLDAL
jgi:hypothetical protein